MLERINWKGISAWGNAYFYTIISIGALLGYLLLSPILTQWSQSPLTILWFSLSIDRILGYISILIGLASVSLALWSIQSTTISLNEIQTDYWNIRGIDEGKRGNYHDAFQAFDKAMRIDSTSIKCLINKANALCEKGKMHRDKFAFIEAIRIVEQAIENGPKHPKTWKNGTPDEQKSNQEYANALKTKCDIIITLVDAFKNYVYNDDLLAEALKASEKAIQEYSQQNSVFSSELPGAYASKAIALSHIGKHDEAIDVCEEAIRLEPYEALAWAIEGNAFHAKGIFLKTKGEYTQAADAYSKAANAYDQAIELKPDHAVFRHNKGNALLNKAMTLLKIIEDCSKIPSDEYQMIYTEAIYCFNESIHAFEKAIEFDPLHLDTWKCKGDALSGQGCNDKAIESYDGAIDISPLDADVQNKRRRAINAQINLVNKEINKEINKGIALIKHSMYGDALQSFDKVIKYDPRFAGAFYYKGLALNELGKYDEALQAYYGAIELDPNNVLAWNGKGHTLKALGRSIESVAAFAEAKKLETKRMSQLKRATE